MREGSPISASRTLPDAPTAGKLWRLDRRISFGLIFVLYVNLMVVLLLIGSHGGQTTAVQIESIGANYRMVVDGKQVIPDPAEGKRNIALDTPSTGSIALTLLAGVPSMPGPQGIDTVIVRSPSGQELLRDSFDALDTTRWEVAEGSFRIEDGVLVAATRGSPNRLVLRGNGWNDYVLTVVYRNAMGAALEARREGGGRTYTSFNLIRDFPVYVEAYSADGTWNGTTFGGYIHTYKREIARSFVAMVVKPYPFMLLALALGALATLALSFGAEALARRLPTARPRRPHPIAIAVSRLRPWLGPALVGFAAVVSLGLTIHIMWEYYRRVPHLPDEASYLYEAKLFAHGQITHAIPPFKEAFYFWSPNFLYEHGKDWSTIYPFGHPLTLAVGEIFDAPWLVTPIVGVGCVILMYLVGKRMYDARTGVVSALLLAASPFFLIQSSNFMSHAPWVLYVLASLNFLLNRTRAILHGALAGLFLGLALNTRPTEAAMLLPAVGVLLLCYLVPKQGRRQAFIYCCAFSAGFGLMIVATLGYNAATTGNPFVSTYLDWDYPGAVLGFNHGHTLDTGMRNQQALLMALVLMLNIWPAWVGLAFVLLPFLLGTRNRWDYFCLACILLVTSVYVLYRWSGLYEGPRYWYQAVPFLLLLTARGAELAGRLFAGFVASVRARFGAERRPTLGAGLLVVYGFVAFLVISGSGGWLFGWNKAWAEPDVPQVPNQIKYVRNLYRFDDRLTEIAERQRLSNALILVRVCGPFDSWGCFTTVFPRNSLELDGNIVWARYVPGRNAEIVDLFPGRKVYVADFDASTINPYDPVADK